MGVSLKSLSISHKARYTDLIRANVFGSSPSLRPVSEFDG
jgi:hypothetical protein